MKWFRLLQHFCAWIFSPDSVLTEPVTISVLMVYIKLDPFAKSQRVQEKTNLNVVLIGPFCMCVCVCIRDDRTVCGICV